MSRRLFHLTAPGATERARREGAAAWRPASLETEGFVHLSYAEQLAGTLAAHFAAAERLELLEVELQEVGSPETELRAERGAPTGLVVEPSRGGELFPHLYRALAWEEIARTWPLERRNASWGLPTFGTAPALDDPPGRPFPPGKRGPSGRSGTGRE